MARLHLCLMMAALVTITASQKPPLKTMSPVKEIRIACGSDDIVVSIFTKYTFNGMVYPKGLSKNSTCMSEYIGQASPLQYRLSLRNCNTMAIVQDDGGIEYFNTIVIQPHLKLVTNQGRGYHVRCSYRTRDPAAATAADDNALAVRGASSPALSAAPVAARMPVCTMRIYSDSQDRQIAETVRIGDPLTLEVGIEPQDVYGLRVIDCLVRDGMGWGQQQLINDQGCPVDFEILGPLNYSDSKTTASVRFEAHKFPYTASVYYQCNVRLCLRHSGDCDDVPPVCEAGQNLRRRRRRRELQNATVTETDGDRIIEVFSGLYVEEGNEPDDPTTGDGPTKSRLDDDSVLCISPRTFAIAIAIVGLLLMVAVVVAIMVIISRRRRRKELSQTGSSIYSGPYTNTAYSHSS